MQYHRKTLSILAAAALLIAGATQLSGCISVPSRESTTVDQTSPLLQRVQRQHQHRRPAQAAPPTALSTL